MCGGRGQKDMKEEPHPQQNFGLNFGKIETKSEPTEYCNQLVTVWILGSSSLKTANHFWQPTFGTP